MKTFQSIYVDSEKARVAKNLEWGWRYCFRWFFISILLIAIWPWAASWWLLTIFPTTAVFLFFVAIFQTLYVEKKGLDLSELHAIINELDKTE